MLQSFLTGDEYDNAIAEKIGCDVCCFVEQSLKGWSDADGKVHVHCEECFATENIEPGLRSIGIYLPEIPRNAFSHLLRAMAWTKFAVKVGQKNFSALTNGVVPRKFHEKNKWNKPFESFSQLKNGALETGKQSTDFLMAVDFITKFFEKREAYTLARYGTVSPHGLVSQMGQADFLSLIRILPLEVDINRIRNWRLSSFPIQPDKEA